MSFEAPTEVDYRNLEPLNRTFLKLLNDDPSAPRLLSGCAPPSAQRIKVLSVAETERLARVRFMLFGFREHDDDFWSRLLDEPGTPGLFDLPVSEALGALIDSALAFAWQLAQRNPYTLRLITGATLYWCELIAEQRLADLIDRYRQSGDVPVLRLSNQADMWKSLLGGGTAAHPEIRRTVHAAALQRVLAGDDGSAARRWSRAASRIAFPARKVADENDHNG